MVDDEFSARLEPHDCTMRPNPASKGSTHSVMGLIDSHANVIRKHFRRLDEAASRTPMPMTVEEVLALTQSAHNTDFSQDGTCAVQRAMGAYPSGCPER